MDGLDQGKNEFNVIRRTRRKPFIRFLYLVNPLAQTDVSFFKLLTCHLRGKELKFVRVIKITFR